MNFGSSLMTPQIRLSSEFLVAPFYLTDPSNCVAWYFLRRFLFVRFSIWLTEHSGHSEKGTIILTAAGNSPLPPSTSTVSPSCMGPVVVAFLMLFLSPASEHALNASEFRHCTRAVVGNPCETICIDRYSTKRKIKSNGENEPLSRCMKHTSTFNKTLHSTTQLFSFHLPLKQLMRRAQSLRHPPFPAPNRIHPPLVHYGKVDDTGRR